MEVVRAEGDQRSSGGAVGCEDEGPSEDVVGAEEELEKMEVRLEYQLDFAVAALASSRMRDGVDASSVDGGGMDDRGLLRPWIRRCGV